MGAGFDKLADTSYFALRFPRLLKIHGDRSFNDTISFEELQEMAKRCNEVLEDSTSLMCKKPAHAPQAVRAGLSRVQHDAKVGSGPAGICYPTRRYASWDCTEKLATHRGKL